MEAETTSTTTTTIGDAHAALALADSSSATPESPAPATEPTAPAATTQAEAATTTPEGASTPAPPETKGEPPKWRWQDILESARTKSAQEAETRVRQELEQQYGGLKDFSGMSADERAGLLIWNRALRGDPEALARVERVNPALASALSGRAPSTAPAQADPEPVVIGRNPDGTEYFNPEAFEQWKAWNARQTDARLEEKLKPFQQVAQTFQQREMQATAWTEVSQVLTRFRTDPDFKANEADVKDEIASDSRLQQLADRDPQAALEIAFSRVYRAKVLPSQKSQTEAQVLADVKTRAVAATTNPASASTSTPKSTIGDARAALDHAMAQLGG